MNAPNSFWQNRPTFVTGATGLLGSWLVERLLEAGADVVCLVRDTVPQSRLFSMECSGRVKIVHGDITDQKLAERALGEYEITTVFHLAAQTIVGVANRNPISTFETNIQGTWALLEACRRTATVQHVVVASSDKAYGAHEVLPYEETAPLRGRHPYDVSKSCADLISMAYSTSFGLPVCVTRCGNLYGGGDLNWNRIVPGTIRSLLSGERPVIRSDGSFIRDYFYVEDGALAYMLLAEAMASRPALCGEAFNFSNELQVTALELVQAIIRACSSDLEPVVRNEAQNEIRHQFLSASKARNVLNWKPTFSLDTGLERTIAWYRSYFRVYE